MLFTRKMNIERRCVDNKCTQKRCDIVYVIMRYLTPLMQCLTNDIREYNMQLLTTKCLNTAVMLMFFLLGRKGLEHSRYCDSHSVIDRHNKGIDNNKSVMKKMFKCILNKRISSRYVYYILMNDGYFDAPSKPEGRAYFPGHVFIIERSFSGSDTYFNLYQSYINEYDLKGYYIKNRTLRYTFEQMKDLLQKLQYITSIGTWDDKCVQYWMDFTHVDTSNLKGAHQGGKLFICFSYDKLKVCVENIKHYVNEKLGEIRNKVKSKEDMRVIYGNPSYYNNSPVKPLTYGDMKINLESILTDIQKNKNNL